MNLRVRFAETDQMGVVHHAAYVVWLEAARVEWMRERGLSYRALEEGGLSMAVSGLEVRYRSACRFDDVVRIDCALVELRSRHATFDYRLFVEDRLVATARTTHVPTDRRGRAVRLPADWSEAFAPHLERA